MKHEQKYSNCPRCSNIPMPGDAFVLSGDYYGIEKMTIGVINGVIGEYQQEYTGVFNPQIFRDDKIVSCSGGPCPTIKSGELSRGPIKTVSVNCWKWGPEGPRAGGGSDYTVTVPVWYWRGRDNS